MQRQLPREAEPLRFNEGGKREKGRHGQRAHQHGIEYSNGNMKARTAPSWQRTIALCEQRLKHKKAHKPARKDRKSKRVWIDSRTQLYAQFPNHFQAQFHSQSQAHLRTHTPASA